MNKVEEILKSWSIYINPNERQSEIAAKRIEICDSCENKQESPYKNCKLCRCALKVKVFSPTPNACPAGKWDC